MPPKRNARKQSGCLMGGLQITRKESERQRRKGKIYTSKCRVPEKRKKRQETLLEWTMQRNRGKQQNGKEQRVLQETGDTEGIFQAKTGIVNDRNDKDPTEAEDIKKGQQEYTEDYTKKACLTMMMWSLIASQASWGVKSSGPQEASL